MWSCYNVWGFFTEMRIWKQCSIFTLRYCNFSNSNTRAILQSTATTTDWYQLTTDQNTPRGTCIFTLLSSSYPRWSPSDGLHLQSCWMSWERSLRVLSLQQNLMWPRAELSVQEKGRSVWMLFITVLTGSWTKFEERKPGINQPSVTTHCSIAQIMTMAELVVTEVVQIYQMCFWREVDIVLTSHGHFGLKHLCTDE